MEALLREILASPHAATQNTAEGAAAQVMAVGGVDAVVAGGKVEGGEAVSGVTVAEEKSEEEDIKEEKTTTASTDAAVAEWANEIEMQRILDEMIVLTGLVGDASSTGTVDGAQAAGDVQMSMDDLTATEYTNPELSLGLDLGLGMDLAGMGFNMDFTTSGWDVDASMNGMGGVGVF